MLFKTDALAQTSRRHALRAMGCLGANANLCVAHADGDRRVRRLSRAPTSWLDRIAPTLFDANERDDPVLPGHVDYALSDPDAATAVRPGRALRVVRPTGVAAGKRAILVVVAPRVTFPETGGIVRIALLLTSFRGQLSLLCDCHNGERGRLICSRWVRWVCGDRFRTCMSSSIRWRRVVMVRSFAKGAGGDEPARSPRSVRDRNRRWEALLPKQQGVRQKAKGIPET